MKKAALALITFLLTVLTSVHALANTNFKTYDSIQYATNDETAIITGYSRGVLTIPKELNGLPVADISDEGFASLHHPTVIILPDSVINIGTEAFANMSADFRLGNSVKIISDYALSMNCVMRITMPDSVESIG